MMASKQISLRLALLLRERGKTYEQLTPQEREELQVVLAH